MARAAIMLALLLLGGCASARREAADPDEPKQVCEHTLEGSQTKTVCY